MNNTLLAIDIGSFSIHAVIAKHDIENNINILGVGSYRSAGIKKGLIVDSEEASKAIKNAIHLAKNTTNEPIDGCVVSISGSETKSLRSSGSVNIPNGIITETEINQVMQMALYNVTIVPEYEAIHVIPIYFKIDDSVEIDNPLNLNGSRLEVSVFIVTAKKTALTNIKSILNVSGIESIKFVLDSYATSLSVLSEQQKKFGVTVIDMGSTTTEFVTYRANSVIYNGFLPIASNNITNDLSAMLHTPPEAAEQIKMKYGSLIKDYNPNNDLGATKIRISRLGDEDATSEIALDHIQTIIHARVEENLILVRNQLKKSGILDNIGSGIVMTGGLSNLDGIKELAENVFEGIHISIGIPKAIKNPSNVNFDEPEMSTIVGLLMYFLSTNRTYQLDSSKRLIKPIKDADTNDTIVGVSKPIQTEIGGDNIKIQDDSEILTPLDKKKKSNFWDKIKDIF